MVREMFSDSFVAAFYALYQERIPSYRLALTRTCESLQEIVRDRDANTPAEQRRVRVELGRIKEPNRILLKAQHQKYEGQIEDPADIFAVIHDIAGTRVTCNTYEDVRRVEQHILGATNICLFSGVPENKAHEDYLARPKESGYRALHLLLEAQVPVGREVGTLPCEVQLRTLLQHAWGELTHEDTFKPEVSVPPLVSVLSKRLATALAVLDEIAQDLRDELNKIEQGAPAEVVVDETKDRAKPSLSATDIEDAFADVMGRILTQNRGALQSVGRRLVKSGIADIDELRRLLERVKVAARAEFSEHGRLMTDSEILNAAVKAATDTRDTSIAVRQVLDDRVEQELLLAAFGEKYAPGTTHMGTIVRVAPRYAIAQLDAGAQALVSARHLEVGRLRVDLRDRFGPGDTVRLIVVRVDPGSTRIEVRPASLESK